MRKSALITGASAGIGYELSKVFAKNGYDLILVARNKERLKAIAEEFKKQGQIEAKVIAKDLSKSETPEELYDQVNTSKIDIDVLVNNAGIAAHGKFTDSSIQAHMDLIQLNVTALTILCKLFGADMSRKGSGKILNVASTAAFQAGPHMSTYYASKAFVLSFSEALQHELKKDGVSVTALCPGPTKTEFFERNDMAGTKLQRSPHNMSAARVAELGYSGLMQGKSIVITGLINRLLAFSVRLAPRKMATSIASSLNQR
jgi:short-subunit dehydrogenase